jgi:hypothetical protein
MFLLIDGCELYLFGYFQTLLLTSALTSVKYKCMHFIDTLWNEMSWITRTLKCNVFLVKHHLRTIAKQGLRCRSDVWEVQTYVFYRHFVEQNVLDYSSVKK